MANFPPLRKVTDGDRWDAADLLGRLSIIAHAAFLYVGFLPYGTNPFSDEPPKQARRTAPTSSFSCRYTLPELVARRKGADAAVLRLSMQGGGCVLLNAYVTGSDGGRRRAYRDRLDAAALDVVAGGLDDAVRALGPCALGAWLWRALADGVCRDLFVDVCGSNGVSLEPGLASLPADVTAAILERVADGRDLARVECAGKELHRVVAAHDVALWKAKYEAMCYKPESSKEEGLSWKERYVRARPKRWVPSSSPPAAADRPVPRMPSFPGRGLMARMRYAADHEDQTRRIDPVRRRRRTTGSDGFAAAARQSRR